ncbi:MAG: hypothetical protein ACI843_002783 [Psychrobacter glaciei]|jgi:hypothetical protein
MSEEKNKIDNKSYSAIITSLKSPLSFFGLAMLICNAIFSVSAAFMGDIEAFKYSIHTFLAIIFAFIIIAIWSPRSLYHPSELVGLDKELPEIKNARPIITSVLLVSALLYAGYHFGKG